MRITLGFALAVAAVCDVVESARLPARGSPVPE
jgi:hypothetical protein